MSILTLCNTTQGTPRTALAHTALPHADLAHMRLSFSARIALVKTASLALPSLTMRMDPGIDTGIDTEMALIKAEIDAEIDIEINAEKVLKLTLRSHCD